MSFKKYTNGAWQEMSSVKKYYNGAWREVSFVRKYVNGAWQDVYPNLKYIGIQYGERGLNDRIESKTSPYTDEYLYCDVSKVSNYAGFEWDLEYPTTDVTDCFYGEIQITSNRELLPNLELRIRSCLVAYNNYWGEYDIDNTSGKTYLSDVSLSIYYMDGTSRYIDLLAEGIVSYAYGGMVLSYNKKISEIYPSETNGQKTIQRLYYSESIGTSVDKYAFEGEFSIYPTDASKYQFTF